MPINPSIALQVQPPPQQDMLGSLAKILQVKNAMAQQTLIPGQQQLQQQEVERGAIQLKNAQQVQDAFASANQKNPDGSTSFNMDNLKAALSTTPGGLDALTHITAFEKGQADLQDAQSKVDLLHRNTLGSIGGAVDKLLATDPLAAGHLFLTMGSNAVANKTIDPKAATPFLTAVQQALAQDPTGQSAAPILKRITSAAMQNSPEYQKTAAEALTAQGAAQRGQAAADQAATAKTREAAAEQDRGYTQAVGQLATNPPPTKEAYAAAIDQLPKGVADRVLRAVAVEQYDPQKSPGILNQSAMTPEQRFNANKPAPERSEADLALAAAKGTQSGASPADVAAGQQAEAALKRLDQSKREARPNINVNMTPAEASNTAGMIARGEVDPATTRTMLRRQPGLLSQVHTIDPGFDEVDIDKRYNTAKEFSSSSNTKAGGQVIALNTLIHHADLYLQTAEALKNGSFVPGNAVYNAVSSAFGSAPPTQANMVARFFAGETGKVATGGVPAEGEINGILQNLGTNASPDQIAGAGKSLLQIASGRMIPLQEKLKDAHLEKQFPVVGADATDILTRRGFDPATMKPVASGNIPTPASQAEYNALSKGAQFRKPNDPKVYTKQ